MFLDDSQNLEMSQIHKNVLEQWRLKLSKKWNGLPIAISEPLGSGITNYLTKSGSGVTLIPPKFMYDMAWIKSGKIGPFDKNWLLEEIDTNALIEMVEIMDEQSLIWSSDFYTLQSEIYAEFLFYTELIRVLIYLLN